MPKEATPFVDVDMGYLESFLERAKGALQPGDFEFLQGLVRTYLRLRDVVRERGTTIARLRRLFGLSGSEKSRDVLASKSPDSKDGGTSPNAQATPSAASEVPPPPAPNVPAAEPTPELPAKKRKGHGRVPASAYSSAPHTDVPHQALRPGDTCPGCNHGSLFDTKRPAPIIRIFGQPPLAAERWDCQRLRCGSCGVLYTAQPPPEALGPKYDETASSMMGILRYGNGHPFNRLQHLQENLDTPVPASTQWDVLNERVELIRPAFEELRRVAAQGNLIHNDDSYMRILQYMGKRRAALLAAGKLPDPERTGLFTTAIISLVASVGYIALFFTGRKHAGENLAEVLSQRAAELPPPIHMADALSRNLPQGHKVLESNCISHGRRKVVDELENYPTECRHLLESLAAVFKVDAECKKARLSDEHRLAIHQTQSGPVMDELQKWMAAQLDEKRIEPNCALGQAFTYFLKRWEKFTLFLRVPGAPLDNNICERGLKMTIRHRRNSLFYRSLRGAQVGDIWMSLIHTAELHGKNAFHYLTALQRHYKSLAQKPSDWLPWTYEATLQRLHSSSAQAPAARAA